MEVSTCWFVKRDCTHEQLFCTSYQRVNRSQGVKILRCFPHCCPNHISRSYCGSTVELLAHIASPEPLALRVFARVRPYDNSVPTLRVGDCISPTRITSSLQSETNTTTEWISSWLVSVDGNGHRFVINPSGRWYYSWRSSKQNDKRLAPHVLEAFVFQVEDDDATMRVLATACSPSFTIASFRRVLSDSTPSSDTTTNQKRTHGMATYPRQTYRGRLSDTRSQVGEVHQRPVGSQPLVFPLLSSRRFPEQLSKLFAYANRLSVDTIRTLIPRWSDLEAGGHRDVTVAEALACPPSSTRMCETVAHLVWWLSIDGTISMEWMHCALHAERNREALYLSYNRWLQWLEDRTNAFLLALHNIPFSRFVDANPLSFHDNEGFQHRFDWSTFVVQAHIVGMQDRVENYSSPNVGPQQENHSRSVWKCPFHRINIASRDQSGSLNLHEVLGQSPFMAVVAFWQHLSRIRITLHGIKLSISTPNLIRTGTILVLDREFRRFDALPNGDSALHMSPMNQTFGDYVASVDSNGEIRLKCYSWPTTSQDCAYEWRWGFHRDSLNRQRLDVHVVVLVGQVEQTADMAWRSELATGTKWQELFHVHLPYSRSIESY